MLVNHQGHTERHCWCDLWRNHNLFSFLAWRCIPVRYKQAAVGIFGCWAALFLLLLTTIKLICVRHAGKASSRLCAISHSGVRNDTSLAFFSSTFAEAGISLTANAIIITGFPSTSLP